MINLLQGQWFSYGALLSFFLVCPFADFHGRKNDLITAALLYVLCGLLTGSAPTSVFS
ncbi:hypothetical protein V6Z11_A03G062600 [Gossypium hirsutum]